MNRTFSSIAIVFFLLWIMPLSYAKVDIIDELTALFKTGNSKELAHHFDSDVELTVLTEEDVYSKTQAEAVLKDFFLKHPPAGVKIIHRLTSNPNYRFVVFILTTDKGSFRTSISMKNIAGKFLVTEVRIEANE
ncbi:DUF4783 domain-containing protein [Rubrolithibacter danxiaensis]|uniref:DUF4783 domain-containing protein n=1 Tax=Rubrolithibacter danxiaensis TaxID=3390805 RepID=UPI003BF81CE2